MNEQQSIEQAVEAFNNLSRDDINMLKELNAKIQAHSGKWGIPMGSEKTADGSIEMPWIEKDPLILESLDFMYDKNLMPIFSWSEWDKGVELLESEDSGKFNSIDVATALKLIYFITRKDRFSDGTLVWAFESGIIPELLMRLEVINRH